MLPQNSHVPGNIVFRVSTLFMVTSSASPGGYGCADRCADNHGHERVAPDDSARASADEMDPESYRGPYSCTDQLLHDKTSLGKYVAGKP
jgi:hypothetical protein